MPTTCGTSKICGFFFAENLSKSDDTFGAKIAQELPEIPNISTADVVKKQKQMFNSAIIF